MFGINLGAHMPVLHWIHNISEQTNLGPFSSISQYIRDALERDFEEYSEILLGKNCLELKNVRYMCNTPFRTVNVIVKLFQELCEIKRSHPDVTWMEAQSYLREVDELKMTTTVGQHVIHGLKEQLNSTFSVFIDNVSLTKDGKDNVHEKRMLMLTHGIIRAIGIVPILSGRDANVVDICSETVDVCGSRRDLMMDGMIVNDLPTFNMDTLNVRCAAIIHKLELTDESHAVLRFLELLKCIRLYENPGLIDKALQYLESQEKEKLLSWDGSLDSMLHSLSTSYIDRQAPHDYNTGQVGYIMSHSMHSDGNLLVNHLNKSCISGHLARLGGVADYYGDPFTSVTNFISNTFYFTHEFDEYKVCSHYTPFSMAPLSGLVMFGLDLSGSTYPHDPFVGEKSGDRITCFEAVRRAFERNVAQPGDCTLLESLYHAAAVVASRANGLDGCSMLQFLNKFVCELRPRQAPLLVKGNHEFNSRRVPILAPMSAPGWPEAIVEYLTHTSNRQSINFGVFKRSPDGELVDSIIYECGIAPPMKPKPIIPKPAFLPDNTNFHKKIPFSDAKRGAGKPEEYRLSNFGCSDAEKLYGYLGDKFEVNGSSSNRISIVGECKKAHEKLKLQDIMKIVDRFDTIQDCKTFIVLCLSTDNFNQKRVYNATFRNEKSRKDIHILTHLNKIGYYIWFIDNGEDGAFELKPIPSQVANENKKGKYSFKDVIVIGCAAMWTKSVLDQVRRTIATF